MTKDQGKHQPIRVALLGTGIFAASCSFPTIRKLSDKFKLVAVWSRKKESVESFIHKHIDDEESKDTMPSYFGNKGLEQILHSQTLAVDAVVMALPFSAQATFIQAALEAGKHVLSEKPIAPTIESAQKLVDFYDEINRKRWQQSVTSTLQWSVAENFRYEPGIERVARAIENSEIGLPTLFSLILRLPFKPDNKYLHTEWRAKPVWYGGLMPDVFVHSTALLRRVFSATHAPKQVSSVTTSIADHIPSIDTMSATMSFGPHQNKDNDDDNGNTSHLHGTVSLSFACTHVRYELEVVGTKGSILLQRKTKAGDTPGYSVTMMDENGKETLNEDYHYGGIDREFIAFANACYSRGRNESIDPSTNDSDFGDLNTPLEAMRDIELVEACLTSGKDNGKPVVL